jgi:hypothetical protein
MAKLNIFVSIITLTVVIFLAFKPSLVDISSTPSPVIKPQPTRYSDSFRPADTSTAEIANLRQQIVELKGMVQELSLQIQAGTNISAVSNSPEAPSQATLEANARGSEFVEQIISQGVLNAENNQLLSQHLAEMSLEQRKEVTQRIAQAVNEQRLQFDPSAQ